MPCLRGFPCLPPRNPNRSDSYGAEPPLPAAYRPILPCKLTARESALTFVFVSPCSARSWPSRLSPAPRSSSCRPGHIFHLQVLHRNDINPTDDAGGYLMAVVAVAEPLLAVGVPQYPHPPTPIAAPLAAPGQPPSPPGYGNGPDMLGGR